MANTFNEDIFGYRRVGRAILDTGATLEGVAAGTTLLIEGITATIVSGTSSPTIRFRVEDQNAKIIFEGMAGAGASTERSYDGDPIRADGLQFVAVTLTGTAPIAAVNVDYIHLPTNPSF